MSGAMRRIGEYLGLVDDSGRYDAYDDEETSVQAAVPAEEPRTRQAERPHGRTESRPAPRRQPAAQPAVPAVSDLAERRLAPVPTQPEVPELRQIVTLTPTAFNEARTIGENYREGIPVIMNVTGMADDDARRLVDFAAGLVFALHGTIERVTNKVFLLSPQNVQVSAEDRERIAEGEFFNQS